LNLIPNMASNASVSQLYFSVWKTSEDVPIVSYYEALLNYPFEKNETLANILNSIIKEAKDFGSAYRLINEKFVSYKTQSSLVKSDLMIICRHFFQNKSFDVVKAKGKEKSRKTKNFIETVLGKKIEKVFSVAVGVWWEFAINQKIKGYKDGPPKVIIENSEIPEYSGLYEAKKHTISYDVGSYDMKDIETFISLLKKGDVLKLSEFFRENTFGNDFFGEKSTSSTFPHELEHARVKDSHKHSSHGTSNEALFPGEKPKSRTFNERTNEVYSFLKMKGYWNEVVKRMK